jgi:predicted GH43/DUF377 family glycosyl hydrolase
VKPKSVAAAVLFALTIVAAGAIHAEWLDSFQYRRPMSLQSVAGDSLVNYQAWLPVGAGFDFAKTSGDGRDVCVTLDDGVTPVPYWLEKWDTAAGVGSVWIKAPLLTADDTLLYLYYGHVGATSWSNGDSTFETYDGFEGYDVGTSPEIAQPNPGEWSRHPGNPLLAPGPPGAWDDHGATFASVIYDSAAVEFRMYYHGYSFTGVHQVGLATSPDGIAWTKYAGNPIMTPGPDAWDGQSVRVPVVWKEGPADYRMIYTGAGDAGMQVGYATSSDGIAWTKHPANPVFNDPTWAHGQTENWGVMKVGSEYLMWYSTFGMRQSGIAVSTDLVNWTPHQAGPIFASSGDPADDRYSQYCPFSFKYGEVYYVLMPSYTSESNYSRNYLYRSSSPFFPPEDRQVVRVTRTVGPEGAWDDHDGDTPYILTLDIERTKFYNDELWCYYSSEGGGDLWCEGLMIEHDIALALVDMPLPEPGGMWSVSGNVAVVDDPVHSGQKSVRHADASGSDATQLTGSFGAAVRGRVSAWMRRASSSAGDYDIYLYGGNALACVAGLGRDGDFHYWNGAFQPTGVAWTMDAWYLVTLRFDAGTGLYDFIVHDDQLSEIVRVEGIAFGNAAPSIDKAMLYTSMGYVGDAFADDFRLAKWRGAEISVAMGAEESMPTGTEGPAVPLACALHQNFPNPFNPTTRIAFGLNAPGAVSLRIYDASGRLVRVLVEGARAAGNHAELWDGRDSRGAPVASGIYFYRLEAGAFGETRKMVLLR